MQRATPMRPSRWAAVGVDAVVVVAAYAGALVFRFERDIPSLYLTRFAAFIPLIVATYVVAGYFTHVYSSHERVLRVLASSLLSLSLILALEVPTGYAYVLPLSVVVLGGLVFHSRLRRLAVSCIRLAPLSNTRAGCAVTSPDWSRWSSRSARWSVRGHALELDAVLMVVRLVNPSGRSSDRLRNSYRTSIERWLAARTSSSTASRVEGSG